MTTYKMCYQHKNSHNKTEYFVGIDSDEEAAWHAKNYCDLYGYTLIDIKPVDK